MDVVTSRRTEPGSFQARAEGDRVNEDGASRLSDDRASLSPAFLSTPDGVNARGLVDNLSRISQRKTAQYRAPWNTP